MSIIVSEELRDRVDVKKSISNKVENIVTEINITDDKVYLHLHLKNILLKDKFLLESFNFYNNKYFFVKPLYFTLNSIKKSNNNVEAVIFIDENIFWEGMKT